MRDLGLRKTCEKRRKEIRRKRRNKGESEGEQKRERDAYEKNEWKEEPQNHEEYFVTLKSMLKKSTALKLLIF